VECFEKRGFGREAVLRLCGSAAVAKVVEQSFMRIE
jgi:hypothetical protein